MLPMSLLWNTIQKYCFQISLSHPYFSNQGNVPKNNHYPKWDQRRVGFHENISRNLKISTSIKPGFETMGLSCERLLTFTITSGGIRCEFEFFYSVHFSEPLHLKKGIEGHFHHFTIIISRTFLWIQSFITLRCWFDDSYNMIWLTSSSGDRPILIALIKKNSSRLSDTASEILEVPVLKSMIDSSSSRPTSSSLRTLRERWLSKLTLLNSLIRNWCPRISFSYF